MQIHLKKVENQTAFRLQRFTFILQKLHFELQSGISPYKSLIYLTSSDADGSLGGLTSIGANKVHFEKIIMNALRKAQWCSADPLCITTKQQGFSSLNYSACHDCLLIPETSCEFRNVLLDRASLIGTDDNKNIGFFADVLYESN